MNTSKVAEYELYRRIKLLGEGSYGKAYLVECLSDKQLCVIKQMDMNNMNEDEKKETIKEARILEALKHPNIVKFREVYKTQKGKLCIVMEYAEGGDLAQKIKEQKSQYFKENLVLDWFTQMSLAIKHCHDRKIIHRDLKSQNIFLNKDSTILLGDFGIAKVLSHTRQKCKTMVGTPYYLSPEIINYQMYSFKTDIWSLGIVLYEICALKPPFDAVSIHQLALKIVSGKYSPIPSMYSRDMTKLISQLLQVDPNKRPNINEVLKMPIIQNRIKNFLSETVRQCEFSHTIIHNKKFVTDNDNIGFPQAPKPAPIPQIQKEEIQQQLPLRAIYTPQQNQQNNLFNKQGQPQRLGHNPSTPQLTPQIQYNQNPFIINKQHNNFDNQREKIQPINYQHPDKKSVPAYVPSKYEQRPNNNKPLIQQIEEKKYEIKKFEEQKLEKKSEQLQKNEQLYNKIVNSYLNEDNKKQQREDERNKMKKDIYEKRKQIQVSNESPSNKLFQQNQSKNSNDQKEAEMAFTEDKQETPPFNLKKNIDKDLQIKKDEVKAPDVSHMPNNFDYLNQVLVELESLMYFKSDEDSQKVNKENSEHFLAPEDPENPKDKDIQGELDNSVAQVMKKYEENDDDREDDDEDLYLINDEVIDETPKISLFILLKDQLGKENAIQLINYVKQKIKQNGLESFAIEGYQLMLKELDFIDQENLQKNIGVVVMFLMMDQ